MLRARVFIGSLGCALIARLLATDIGSALLRVDRLVHDQHGRRATQPPRACSSTTVRHLKVPSDLRATDSAGPVLLSGSSARHWWRRIVRRHVVAERSKQGITLVRIVP